MQILEDEDKKAFDALLSYYYNFDIPNRYLFSYVYVMVEQYGDDDLYMLVYYSLSDIASNEPVEQKKGITSLALSYLKKALKKENFTARLELARLFKEGVYVEKNIGAAEYLESGGYDIDGFLKKQYDGNASD
jgi:hypothetical protein